MLHIVQTLNEQTWVIPCCSNIFIYGVRVEPSSLLLRPFVGLLYQPWMIDGDDFGANSGRNEWQGKPKFPEKTRPSVAI
jgi:hypothetical protein